MQEEIMPQAADEPTALSELPEDSLVDRIRRLMAEEPFAVLCTQGEGQPYGSVIAVAVSADLKACCFTTPTATRKYRLLSECDRVALVVDNRDRFPGEIMRTSALTLTGRASQVGMGPEYDRWADLLLARHPYLSTFVAAPSTALFRITITRYLYVTRFQEVRQWIPA